MLPRRERVVDVAIISAVSADISARPGNGANYSSTAAYASVAAAAASAADPAADSRA